MPSTSLVRSTTSSQISLTHILSQAQPPTMLTPSTHNPLILHAIPRCTQAVEKVLAAAPHDPLRLWPTLPWPWVAMSTLNRLRQGRPAAASTPLSTLPLLTIANLGSRRHRKRLVRLSFTNLLRPTSQTLPSANLRPIHLPVLSLMCCCPAPRYPLHQRHPWSISPRKMPRVNGSPNSLTSPPLERAPSLAQVNFRLSHFPHPLRRNKPSSNTNDTSAPRAPRPFRDQALCASTRTPIPATSHSDVPDLAAGRLSLSAPT